MSQKLNIGIIFLFINSFLLLQTQIESEFLINETFSSKVGYMCEETTDDDPCAGFEIYLVLKFSKEKVIIIEKEVSSCDTEQIASQLEYKWELTEDSEIKMDINPKDIKYHFLKDLILKTENKTIIGYKENGSKNADRYEFIKQ